MMYLLSQSNHEYMFWYQKKFHRHQWLKNVCWQLVLKFYIFPGSLIAFTMLDGRKIFVKLLITFIKSIQRLRYSLLGQAQVPIFWYTLLSILFLQLIFLKIHFNFYIFIPCPFRSSISEKRVKVLLQPVLYLFVHPGICWLVSHS